MKTLEEFEKENVKYKTVGELVRYLSTLPTEVKIHATDADSGGYDVSTQPWVTAHLSKDNKDLFLGTGEYEAGKDLSYENYKKFLEEVEV